MKALCFFTILFLIQSSWASQSYQDGDIIFIQSTSPQSLALEEGTESHWTHVGLLFSLDKEWYVHEASAIVKATPLKDFIKKSKEGRFAVKRLNIKMTKSDRLKLSKTSYSFFGKKYDLMFMWDDRKIYCSELVYKVFKRALGVEVGLIQKLGDLKRSGPQVQSMMNNRWLKDLSGEKKEGELKRVLAEKVVTPVSQFNDSQLICIESSPSKNCEK